MEKKALGIAAAVAADFRGRWQLMRYYKCFGLLENRRYVRAG